MEAFAPFINVIVNKAVFSAHPPNRRYIISLTSCTFVWWTYCHEVGVKTSLTPRSVGYHTC